MAGSNQDPKVRERNEPMLYKDTVTFERNLRRKGIQDAVTAGTTQTQAGGTAINNVAFVFVSVCANTADSITLPVADEGSVIEIRNAGAATCKVWPAVGGTINGGSANAADATQIGIGNSVKYVATSATNWNSLHCDAV